MDQDLLLRTATDALLARVLKGDASRLDELLRRAGTRLMALISLRMSDRLKRRLDPEDVLQEVYMEALRGLDRFEHRGPGSFYAWLAAIAVNTIRTLEDHAGAAKRDVRRDVPLAVEDTSCPRGVLSPAALAAAQTSPSQAAVRWEMFQIVCAAMEGISREERDVITLRYLQGLSTEETARTLALDPGKIYVLLSRGLARVRDKLHCF